MADNEEKDKGKEHRQLMTAAEVNKIEHAQLRKDITHAQQCYDEQEQRWFDLVQSQEEKRQGFEERVLQKIETVTGGLSAIDGMNSALMSRIGDVNREMVLLRDEQAQRWKDFMEIKVHVDDIRKLMQDYHLPKIAEDVGSAWKQIRINTERLAKLEMKGGRIALRILKWIAVTVGGLLAGYIFWALTGFRFP